MPRNVQRFAGCVFLVWLLSPGPVASQSLTGTAGLVTIPTAEMPHDGAAAVGANLIQRRYHGSPGEYPDSPTLVRFASIGFLPFAEVGLRLTRRMDRQGPHTLGDRMVTVRLRVIRETAIVPAVVVGAQDIVGTRIFHSLYVVGSKSLDSVPILGRVSATLGYGDDWGHLPAKGHQFQGVFTGISIAPRPWAALMVEHDAQRVNLGMRLGPVRGIRVLAALQGMRGRAGGISYTHHLH